MDINYILAHFSSQMAQIVIHQRTARDLRKSEFEKLRRISQAFKSDPVEKNQWIEEHTMGFTSAKDGEFRHFGSATINVEQQKLAILLYQNKQYRWLLAEAFELFEDFIEEAYAFLGHSDHDSWSKKDIGEIPREKLSDQNYLWYRERAKSKELKNILSAFRNRYIEIDHIERENKLGVNLRLVISLIEKMRHVIVHNGGITSNKQKLIEQILGDAGFHTKGKQGLKQEKERQHLDRLVFINRYFGHKQYVNTIILIESKDPRIPFPCHTTYFTFLLSSLMSYAHMVYEQLLSLKPRQ